MAELSGFHNKNHYRGLSNEYCLPDPIETCKILNAAEVIEAQLKWADSKSILAFYSSAHNGIITDPKFMTIPFGDHMVHRGHSVFDTGTLINGRLYRLDEHLERFFKSMALAKINSPFKNDYHARDIIALTCAASGVKNATIRFWVSAGGSDFLVHPEHCIPTFYVALFDVTARLNAPLLGLKEVTVDHNVVPLKPGVLCRAKTTNYLLNALCAVEAVRKGGRYGIWLDEEKNVAEAAIASIVMVTKKGEFVMPTFDKILAGLTMIRAYEAVSNLIKDSKMPPAIQHINKLAQRHISYMELIDAAEIIVVGGDFFVEPITQIDNHLIAKGVIGPLTKWLHRFLLDEACDGILFSNPVPYDLYQKRDKHDKQIASRL